ncbi:MAG: hypothetical protein ACE5JP_02390 [Candidatus Bipolaricaulia bacterium]
MYTRARGDQSYVAQRPKKLLNQVRDAIRLKHYSIRTEQAYVTVRVWIGGGLMLAGSVLIVLSQADLI